MAADRTLPPPATLDPQEAPPLRWGILGPGQIARSFAQALHHGTQQRLVAVGSRSLERAQDFANAHQCTARGSYEELVSDPEVDVVYVASPHSEHRDHALLAIEAGKHVLVEKAFTRNQFEAAEVFDAAKERGVFCMEAMWAWHLPHLDVVRRAVQSGALGDLQTVIVDHGQGLFPDGPPRLARPELAGGALLDLGVYTLSFAAMLMPEIASVHANGTLTPDGVDAQEVVTLLGAGGEIAACTSTMTAPTPNTAVVAGDQARIEIDGWFYQPHVQVRLVGRSGEVLDTYDPRPEDREHGLRYEAAEVARCVAAGHTESPHRPTTETLRVMALMDEVRRQLGVVYPGE